MVKETVLDLGLDLTLSSVLSDFKQACINFWRNIPITERRGCYYTVELYRSEDGILKCFVQKTATTCFVPPSFVWVAWQGVQQEAAPELDDINDFVYYFDRTWNDDQFRLQQWNYYNYDGPTTITLKAGTPGWSESWATTSKYFWNHWCHHEKASYNRNEFVAVCCRCNPTTFERDTSDMRFASFLNASTMVFQSI